ncbi:competence protein CoiA [Salegentibacter mishustinae]|uniref:Competence protein CoiA nuclease-like domain-containing protein n=1 Tax=Salegentibacter mishustinae TaxID=270918 RepID=A0A0Q9ZKA8_9FLAO|nr:hypothetical protein [Salegentibacter mishustinae]KRG29572.1 hypothetical protein APR42_16295 [Salegentibacter mishustinae]PNW21343.1 hypothetical protein APB85_08795 [Salegentibacter mishustinae]PZX60634.1 competence protein CoiA [Salegentibacter mishustinae]GGX00841.1 hypothetical protein GCM10008086_32400 [Salegentibacter mishustinae]
MRYALNSNKERVEVSYSKEKAVCQLCGETVNGRKGEERKKHWAHRKKCDHWYEPITAWHLKWQNHFPKENREVVIKKGDEKHRADIHLDNGIIIEIQNSPIKPAHIRAREEFYGKEQLIWILNGKNLLSHCNIIQSEIPFKYSFTIDFPKNISNNINYFNPKFCKEFLKVGILKDFSRSSLDTQIDYENHKIKFEALGDLFHMDYDEKIRQKYYMVNFYQYYFELEYVAEFRDNIKFRTNKWRVDLKKYHLNKKYWKKFIDKMSAPVFLDNLEGIEEDELFWFQKNKTVRKDKFLKKYREFTKTGNIKDSSEIAGFNEKM